MPQLHCFFFSLTYNLYLPSDKTLILTDGKKISWGCVQAGSKKECVEMVANNLADLVDLNATDMFMAGMDYNLAPFMAENYKG